jgi:hypothetical protein
VVVARLIRSKEEQNELRIPDMLHLMAARGVQHGVVILLVGDYCQ